VVALASITTRNNNDDGASSPAPTTTFFEGRHEQAQAGARHGVGTRRDWPVRRRTGRGPRARGGSDSTCARSRSRAPCFPLPRSSPRRPRGNFHPRGAAVSTPSSSAVNAGAEMRAGGGEEEEEEEVFYESRDRVLSSSCSSTSASDDDDNDHPRRRRDGAASAAAAALDVWTSEPAPVQERRRKLLQMMGLAGDPALARLEMGRSVSYDGPVRPAPASPIPRSRSDGAVPVSSTKPPLGGRSRQASSGSSEATPEGEDAGPRCLIRNLDDGTEFVVKEEFQLREVGTGRHFTMEEFVDLCVGCSPIVQELMRRDNVGSSGSNNGASTPIQRSNSDSSNGATRHRRHSSWLRSLRNVAGSMAVTSRDRRSSDEKDTSSEKGGRRSSSATDDSQDSAGASVHHGRVRVKVRQSGKSYKELSGLFMNQEIQAHNGSIWSIRFSPDGRYLASAGEDCVIHVWEVSEFERKREENGLCNPLVAMACNGSPETTLALASSLDGSNREKKRRARFLEGRRSVSSDRLMVPEHVFALSEKPIRTFVGHSEDVLDLCWSKSQVFLALLFVLNLPLVYF
jgi:WD repeat-containing protein 44